MKSRPSLAERLWSLCSVFQLPLLPVLTAAWLGGGGSGQASVIASESFESYAAGPLNGQNGGIGWTGAWTAPGSMVRADVRDTAGNSMSYSPPGGLIINGATRALEVQLSGTPSNQLCGVRTLATPLSQTFYVGYLVRYFAGAGWAGGNNTFTLHLGTNSSSTSTLNFGIRGNSLAGSDEFVLRYGTGSPEAGASNGGQLVEGADNYLVARVLHNGSSFTSAAMWINPTANGETTNPNGDAMLTVTAFANPITHVFWREAALETDDVLRADELKIATTFNDLVPVGVVNPPPTVTLTNPASGTVFATPTNILLEATASDTNGSVTNVSFYVGSIRLADDHTIPYGFNWTNVGAGDYTLTARATDNEGALSISPPVLISVLSTNVKSDGTVSGELKKWHRVTVTWEGPNTSETNANNPFRNYRLNVTFTHSVSGKSYVVPGYFAADGDAANTSADSGNQWRANFAPDETGRWSFVPSFRTGTDVALSGSPTAGVPTGFDGAGGSFMIGPTDKTGRDLRGKGRLQYVSKHHLRFAETGEYFLKMGADSPESLLDYEDFDDQPNVANSRKSWSAHATDYDASDASPYTWAGGKGTELLGVVKYLAGKGLNAFSFIPFTLDGDNKAVFPHCLVSSAAGYEAAAEPRWTKNVVYHDRFDVSKLEQWDRIFAYADKSGMYLHFKTLETENELTMDGGNLGPERALYYRELIARFGYHLALNWNLGEEIDNATTSQKQSWSQYFYEVDPYRHLQVVHNGANHYDLLGTASHLTGFSKQAGPGSIFSATLDYLKRSDDAGVPWVVAYDEQNPANDGIITDGEDFWHDSVRGLAIWSHLLAGGAGCEFYFGYGHPHNDLNCQDLRSRDNWWNQCRYALEFFTLNAVPFWNMTNRNPLLSGLGGTYCYALTGQVYIGWLPTNGVTSLNLAGSPGQFDVRWFNPRSGGVLQTGSISQVTGGSIVSLGSPPFSSTNDWSVLVKLVDPAPPAVSIVGPTNNASLFANLPVEVSATITDNVAVAKAELWVDGVLQPSSRFTEPYQFAVAGSSLGAHLLTVVGQDTSGNRASNSVNVIVIAPEPPRLALMSVGGHWHLEWAAPGFELYRAHYVTGVWTAVVPPAWSPYPVVTTNAPEYFQLRWAP